jgi:hypothetical protein
MLLLQLSGQHGYSLCLRRNIHATKESTKNAKNVVCRWSSGWWAPFHQRSIGKERGYLAMFTAEAYESYSLLVRWQHPLSELVPLQSLLKVLSAHIPAALPAM